VVLAAHHQVAGGGPGVGHRIVDLALGGRGREGGGDIAAGHQHAAIRQQGGGVPGAGSDHGRGRAPTTGLWIVDLGRLGPAFARHHQDATVGQHGGGVVPAGDGHGRARGPGVERRIVDLRGGRACVVAIDRAAGDQDGAVRQARRGVAGTRGGHGAARAPGLRGRVVALGNAHEAWIAAHAVERAAADHDGAAVVERGHRVLLAGMGHRARGELQVVLGGLQHGPRQRHGCAAARTRAQAARDQIGAVQELRDRCRAVHVGAGARPGIPRPVAERGRAEVEAQRGRERRGSGSAEGEHLGGRDQGGGVLIACLIVVVLAPQPGPGVVRLAGSDGGGAVAAPVDEQHTAR